jgi:hypothetical protein
MDMFVVVSHSDCVSLFTAALLVPRHIMQCQRCQRCRPGSCRASVLTRALMLSTITSYPRHLYVIQCKRRALSPLNALVAWCEAFATASCLVFSRHRAGRNLTATAALCSATCLVSTPQRSCDSLQRRAVLHAGVRSSELAGPLRLRPGYCCLYVQCCSTLSALTSGLRLARATGSGCSSVLVCRSA